MSFRVTERSFLSSLLLVLLLSLYRKAVQVIVHPPLSTPERLLTVMLSTHSVICIKRIRMILVSLIFLSAPFSVPLDSKSRVLLTGYVRRQCSNFDCLRILYAIHSTLTPPAIFSFPK